jgi:hypothetical protein
MATILNALWFLFVHKTSAAVTSLNSANLPYFDKLPIYRVTYSKRLALKVFTEPCLLLAFI